MQNLIECPVCTLYLRQGMSLEVHLETHPKDQVIKALVALAARQTIQPNNYLTYHEQQSQEEFIPSNTSLESNRNSTIVTNDNGQWTSSRQNVMVVNRRSTTVFHSMERENQIILPSSIPVISQNCRDKNDISHNQPLPPPPAYGGTAVTQLRYNPDILSIQRHPINNINKNLPIASNEGDVTIRNDIQKDQTSVLRYAESPVTAHVEERDDGDFIVQETPRHIVECVEKDDGDFSVIEKIIHSPPSVLRFHDNNYDTQNSDNSEIESDTNIEENLEINNPRTDTTLIKVLSNVRIDSSSSLHKQLNENLNKIILNDQKYSSQEKLNNINNTNLNEKTDDNLRNITEISQNHEKNLNHKNTNTNNSLTSVICTVSEHKKLDDIKLPPGTIRTITKGPKKLLVKFKNPVPDISSNLSNITKPNSINNEILNKDSQLICSTSSSSDTSIQNNEKTDIFSPAHINNPIDHPHLQPMIVHEPSLSIEPFDDENENNNLNSDNKTEEIGSNFSTILNDCRDEFILPSPLPFNTINSDTNQVEFNSIEKINEIDRFSPKNTIPEASTSYEKDTIVTKASTSTFSKPSTSFFLSNDNETGTNQQNDFPFALIFGNGNDNNRISSEVCVDNQLWSNFNAPLLQKQSDFSEADVQGEKTDYIDLDACTRNQNDDECSPFVEALNIRTDERMPAKGEISEQESNGDIENSWSQPENTLRFTNSYENFATRESWSLSNEELFQAQHGSENINNEKENVENENDHEIELGKVEITETSVENVRCKTQKRTFKCSHCLTIFESLREKNAHLIVIHGYKRLNRRLVKEPLPSTTIIITTTTTTTNTTTNNNATATTTTTTGSSEIDLKDIKPKVEAVELGLISNIDPIPKTKYDGARSEIYKMLMSFNLSVLQEKKNIEIDKSLIDTKSFFCFSCKLDFLSLKQYDEHLITHPAECFTCGRKFTRWGYLSIHLKRHLGWKDYHCPTCSKRFVTRGAMEEHARIHSDQASFKCKLCNKRFKTYSNRTKHTQTCCKPNVSFKKAYVCHCGEVSPSKARLRWHKEIHDTKPKCCPYCRDRFIHLNSLKRHIRLAHSDKYLFSKPAECPICKQKYAKSSIKSHIATHSMDTHYECTICNKSLSTKWNLKIHNWVHVNRTTKPYKCEYCIKAFVRETDYKNHINTHKNIKPYTCEYCGCKFVRKYNYMRHRSEHNEKKKFSCDLCGKLFHRRYNLIDHRRTHTGERPFLCTICGKRTTSKTNHNKHLKIHHSRDPFTSET